MVIGGNFGYLRKTKYIYILKGKIMATKYKNKVTGKIITVISIKNEVCTILTGAGEYKTLDRFSLRAYYGRA